MPDLNLTFCETVDNKVALNQGLKILIERMIGEIAKIRIAFEERPVNYTNYFNLIKRDYILAEFQLMMDKLFTPTFYIINDNIKTSLESAVKLN